MSRYEEGLSLLEERCGNGKDNLISLATIALEKNEEGNPRPCVRDLDAYYEDGSFYIVTWAKATKMEQIAVNKEVAFSVCGEWVSGNGIGENLGWVLDPKNAGLREKLRKAFAVWYDEANNEQDESCVILAIRVKNAIVIKDHGAVRYRLDFANKVEASERQGR